MSSTVEPTQVEDSIFELSPDELDRYPVGVITVDRSGRIVRYNRAESAFARRKPHEVIGRNFFAEVAPCTAVREFEGRFDAFARQRDSGAEKFDFTFAFGWGRQDVSITLVRRADYDEIHIIIRVRSMRRPMPSSARMTLSGAEFDAPREPAAHIGHWIEDAGGVLWSDELYAILGLDRSAGPENYLDFVHPEDIEAFKAVLDDAESNARTARLDHRIVTPGGEIRLVHFQASTYANSEGGVKRKLGTIVDVTEQRRDSQSWWRSAHFDALTGLPNRKMLTQRLEAALAQEDQPLAIIFIDLDRFKLVNDTAGHDVGDQLLRLVASRLLGCLREGDTVARLNGDEFVAVIAGLRSHDAAGDIADVMIGAVSQPFVIDDREYYVTLSAGIALWPHDGSDGESLLQAADIAMYHSKQRGPNGFLYYDSEIRESASASTVREKELRRAVNENELTLYYQPIFDVNGTLHAAEALVRWNHPTLGLLPPGEFIPLAEKSGLIVPIGAWVLRSACAQMHEWRARGIPLPRITINISPAQFKGRHFPQFVAKCLTEAELPPETIELELTESVIVDRFDDTLASLAELKILGVRLAIDDFGTGYSSLSYLKYLPVDTLKLDRAFVIGVGTESLDDAIASTIVSLANNLKLDVIAEGVETQRQLEALRSIGCTHVQGFFLGRPMRPDRFAERFAVAPLGAGR
ncbi:MAG: hypothetical protein NVSMB5_05230 [Candidatus Velthaea sp.]